MTTWKKGHGVIAQPTTSASFRAIELLGSGGFSMVTKEERVATKEVVAIKRLKRAASSAAKISAAERESEILKTIQHPNTIHLIEMFVENDDVCLVLEYFEKGVSTKDVADANSMQRSDKLSVLMPDEITLLTLQITDALTYLHGRDPQIVHGDIKPSNILMIGRGKYAVFKLMDFGASRFEDETYTNSIGFTDSFAAPEVLLPKLVRIQRNISINGVSDVWSFGLTLLNLMCGDLITPIDIGIWSRLDDSIDTLANSMIWTFDSRIIPRLNKDKAKEACWKAHCSWIRDIVASKALQWMRHKRSSSTDIKRIINDQFLTMTMKNSSSSHDRKNHSRADLLEFIHGRSLPHLTPHKCEIVVTAQQSAEEQKYRTSIVEKPQQLQPEISQQTLGTKVTAIRHRLAHSISAALYLIALDIIVLGTSDGDILYVDRRTGEASTRFTHHGAHSKEITSLLMLRDDNTADDRTGGSQKQLSFVSCSKDRCLCVWTLQYAVGRSKTEHQSSMISVNSLRLTGHLEDVLGALQLSRNNLLVSSSQDKTLRLWDLDRSYGSLCILQGHSSPITCFEEVPYDVSTLANNRSIYLVSGSKDKTVRLWQLPTGSCVGIFKDRNNGHILCLASAIFERNASFYVWLAAGSSDTKIHVWEHKLEDGMAPVTITSIFEETIRPDTSPVTHIMLSPSSSASALSPTASGSFLYRGRNQPERLLVAINKHGNLSVHCVTFGERPQLLHNRVSVPAVTQGLRCTWLSPTSPLHPPSPLSPGPLMMTVTLVGSSGSLEAKVWDPLTGTHTNVDAFDADIESSPASGFLPVPSTTSSSFLTLTVALSSGTQLNGVPEVVAVTRHVDGLRLSSLGISEPNPTPAPHQPEEAQFRTPDNSFVCTSTVALSSKLVMRSSGFDDGEEEFPQPYLVVSGGNDGLVRLWQPMIEVYEDQETVTATGTATATRSRYKLISLSALTTQMAPGARTTTAVNHDLESTTHHNRNGWKPTLQVNAVLSTSERVSIGFSQQQSHVASAYENSNFSSGLCYQSFYDPNAATELQNVLARQPIASSKRKNPTATDVDEVLTVAAACADGAVCLWQMTTSMLSSTSNTMMRSPLLRMVYTPKDSLGSESSKKGNHTVNMLCLAFVSGMSLVSGGYSLSTTTSGGTKGIAIEQGVLLIWNLMQHRVLHVLSGHTGRVTAVQLIPNTISDSQPHSNSLGALPRIVSSSRDDTLRVWDCLTGTCLHVLSLGGGASARTPMTGHSFTDITSFLVEISVLERIRRSLSVNPLVRRKEDAEDDDSSSDAMTLVPVAVSGRYKEGRKLHLWDLSAASLEPTATCSTNRSADILINIPGDQQPGHHKAVTHLTSFVDTASATSAGGGRTLVASVDLDRRFCVWDPFFQQSSATSDNGEDETRGLVGHARFSAGQHKGEVTSIIALPTPHTHAGKQVMQLPHGTSNSDNIIDQVQSAVLLTSATDGSVIMWTAH